MQRPGKLKTQKLVTQKQKPCTFHGPTWALIQNSKNFLNFMQRPDILHKKIQTIFYGHAKTEIFKILPSQKISQSYFPLC